MVAPAGVLGVAAGDDAPLVALDGGVADLEGHLADELLPAGLDEVHDGGGLLGRGEGGEDGHTIAQREPAEVHPRRADVADEVAASLRHEVKDPVGDRIRDDVELVYRRVGVLLRLVPVYVVQLPEVQPEVAPHVVAQCVEALHDPLYKLLPLRVLLEQRQRRPQRHEEQRLDLDRIAVHPLQKRKKIPQVCESVQALVIQDADVSLIPGQTRKKVKSLLG